MASGTPAVAEASSSKTLWATASKEWVILPKPKPGRKPKKDSASSQPSEEDPASRRTQNRAAQRAFRERKQSQLAELQARIKSYEEGEIERSVALQKVAKRLKDENQLLREENGTLKTQVAELEARVKIGAQIVPNQMNGLLSTDKKRARDPSPPADSHMPPPHVCKRTRDESMVDYPRHDPFPTETVPSFSSPPGCTTEPINTVDRFPPIPYVVRQQKVCSTIYSTPGNSSSAPDPLPPFLTCGFCEADTLCVCREIACPSPMEQSVDSAKFNTNSEEDLLVASASSNLQGFPNTTSNSRNESTSLDKLPPYEPAVPIRRRNKGVPLNSIFPIHKAPPSKNPPQATCSGDPNNCLACAGDSFGQAFCAAVGSSSSRCDCSEMMLGCCGSTSRCSDCPSTIPPEQMEIIPTNHAWQKLKAHPNVQFADLTLLAEVVARKSVCSGPQLVVSSSTHNSQTNHRPDREITGTRQAGDSPPPRLVPHEVLLECGRKRMRQVRTDGVQEALRLLDAKFS